MIASTLFLTNQRFKNFTDGLTHPTLASGINKLPLTQSENLEKSDFFPPPPEAPILFEPDRPVIFFRIRDGSDIGVVRTLILVGTSSSRLESLIGTSGFDGV